MTGLFDFVKHGHVFVVGGGLLLFWVPLLSRKGSSLHRGAGRLYAAFMCVAGASGAWLAANYLLRPGKRIDGLFLLYALYVFFLIGRCAWRALDAKAGPQALRTPLDLGLDGFAVAAGVAAFVLGLWARDEYLAAAGPFGALVGARHLRAVHRSTWPEGQWLREHLAGMIATGALGYSALIFFELSRYFPAWLGTSGRVAVWLTPSAAGAAAAAVFMARLEPARLSRVRR
jgi:hypothetical protein